MAKIICAMTNNGVIGNKGKLVKANKEDLQLFKTLTLNSKVIMGRKTWDSLPIKPLPLRENIVLTRNPKEERETCEIPKDLSNTWIIGGGEIYELFMKKDLVDEVHLTIFAKEAKGDTKFPLELLKEKFYLSTTIHYKTFKKEIWREKLKE